MRGLVPLVLFVSRFDKGRIQDNCQCGCWRTNNCRALCSLVTFHLGFEQSARIGLGKVIQDERSPIPRMLKFVQVVLLQS